jgi:hypothetical protein
MDGNAAPSSPAPAVRDQTYEPPRGPGVRATGDRERGSVAVDGDRSDEQLDAGDGVHMAMVF